MNRTELTQDVHQEGNVVKFESILCVEAKTLFGILESSPLVDHKVIHQFQSPSILLRPEFTWFAPREVIETREEFKQIIPYVILRYLDKVAVYQRTNTGGEKRLHKKYSIGFGGHVRISDAVFSEDGLLDPIGTVASGAQRELEEEIKHAPIEQKDSLALIYDDRDEVGRVHIGLVEIWRLSSPEVEPLESTLTECQFINLTEISSLYEQMETWSQHCISLLTHTRI